MNFKEIMISQSVLTGVETWAYGIVCFIAGFLIAMLILWRFGFINYKAKSEGEAR